MAPGALLSQFLTGLVEQAERYAPNQAVGLGAVAGDLIAVHLSQYVDAPDEALPGGRRQVLLTKVNAFIEEHLGDPDLTPGTIAAAHFISRRHLHQLFDGQHHTPAAWIRQRRLHRCRADLADPLLAGRPIGAIAARWGFRNAQDFSRAFRAAFGVAPREFRIRALIQVPRARTDEDACTGKDVGTDKNARTDNSHALIARALRPVPDESFQ
ncbi:AraC-like DNA-binding protein [Catenulispora sp. GP43]|uniref:helix-turn-helix domain-containing protein n=1 Tax=Catenulispora sp. GP43 TaxID=3156263 RepID=UPI0035120E62